MTVWSRWVEEIMAFPNYDLHLGLVKILYFDPALQKIKLKNWPMTSTVLNEKDMIWKPTHVCSSEDFIPLKITDENKRESRSNYQ